MMSPKMRVLSSGTLLLTLDLGNLAMARRPSGKCTIKATAAVSLLCTTPPGRDSDGRDGSCSLWSMRLPAVDDYTPRPALYTARWLNGRELLSHGSRRH